MKLDELRTVQSKERRKDSLQQLRDSFYRDVATYIRDLKASRDRRADAVDDPFSDDEVRRLSDELETAEEVAEAIYERRVGKVVKLASFAAADMPVDDEGMTGEERQLFDDLVERITQNKTAVLEVLSGSSDGTAAETPTPATTETATATASDPEQTEPATPQTGGMLADAMGGGETEASTEESPADAAAAPTPEATADGNELSGEAATSERLPDDVPPPVPPAEMESETPTEPTVETSTDGGTATGTVASTAGTAEVTADSAADADGSDETDEDRTTLRITKNVGEIFGVDGREYTLRSEDVVTLPTANAEPLVDRDAAMRLD